ncbi:MAG TPA: recombinase family protein, partial [Tepidisphaeraceae bacterium]
MSDETPIKRAAASAFAGLGVRRDLIGKRYINLLRCSTDHQSETSPDGQKEVNDAYSAVQQMPWAGYDVFAEGVSGSQTFNREDIQEILELKRTRNDFDVVVVFELGRATRGGIRHGNVVEDELKKAGIELVSSTELIPDGPI